MSPGPFTSEEGETVLSSTIDSGDTDRDSDVIGNTKGPEVGVKGRM